MRMDGRLQNVDLPPNSKHPIIFPSRRPVTDMIIRRYHEQEGHCGTSNVLNEIRRKYWILNERAAVYKAGMWKRKRKLEAEAGSGSGGSGLFLWKRKRKRKREKIHRFRFHIGGRMEREKKLVLLSFVEEQIGEHKH